MPDLNLDLDYFSHPKTLRLVGILGNGADVFPIRLWTWCAKHHADSGALTGYSMREIEAVVGWWGKPGELVRAMLKVKLLSKSARTYVVHDWSEYQGHIAPMRERARQAAKARWNGIKQEAVSIASSNAQASPKQSPILSIPSNKRLYSEDSFELIAAKTLFEKILQNDPKAKEPNFQKWAADIDALRRIDGRPEADILAVILFCQKDDFWKSNILSAGKLRKQFAQLFLKMKSVKEKPGVARETVTEPKMIRCGICGDRFLASRQFDHKCKTDYVGRESA